jgi:hypothetical protein
VLFLEFCHFSTVAAITVGYAALRLWVGIRHRYGGGPAALAGDGRLVQGGRCQGGELKWQFKTGSGIVGQPIAYRGPDNHEYVAILSGVGGWAGAIVSCDLDPRDKTAAVVTLSGAEDAS